jgi:hypothetical protein
MGEEEAQLGDVNVEAKGELDKLSGGLRVEGDGRDVELLPCHNNEERKDPEDHHGDGETTIGVGGLVGSKRRRDFGECGMWKLMEMGAFLR